MGKIPQLSLMENLIFSHLWHVTFRGESSLLHILAHSMARANLKKVNTSQLLPPQHQEAQNLHQLKSFLSDPNLLSKCTSKCELVKQDLLNKKQFLKIL